MNKMTLDIQKFASVQTAKYEGRYLKLTVTEESTSIENNTSTIKWELESLNGDSTYYTIHNWGVKVAGQTIYKTQTTNWSTKEFPAKKGSKSGTITIAHKEDGTADPVAFTLTGKVYSSGTATFNGSLNLSTIPRASQPRISGNPTLGSSITIYTDRVSQSFTHTIGYQFGGATGTLGTNIGDSISWTPPISLAQQIPNSTSGAGIIICNTYNGATLIGQKTVAFTASVPTNIVPSISLSNPTIGGSAPAGWGIFVKGKSTANYTITGAGNQGSTISQYQSSVAGYSYTTASVTTGTLLTAGTKTISAKVIDSRGRQATASKTFNVVDYYNPSFTTAQIQRVDVNGNLDDNGQYAKFNFAGSVSSCSGNNKGTYKIAYRVKNTGSYTEKTIATNQQSISQSGFITSDGTQSGTKIQFSNNQSYDIKFMITDAFSTQESLQTLDTGFDLMNFNTSGKSMALGKVSTRGTSEKWLDIGLDTQFDKNTYGRFRTEAVARVGSEDADSNGWYKVCDSTMSGYGNTNITWLVQDNYNSGFKGILNLEIRCSNASPVNVWKCEWLIRGGFAWDSVGVVVDGYKWTLYINRTQTRYGRITFTELSHYNINGTKPAYTVNYYNTTTKEGTEPTFTKRSTTGGKVATADNATNATNATKATNDGSGNNIVNTYQTKLSVTSGTTGLSKSSGSSTINAISWYKYGRVIHLWIEFKTTASIASENDIMAGTITNTGLTPIKIADGVGYLGARAIIFRIRENNTFTLRNAGASSIGTNSTISASVTYISNS